MMKDIDHRENAERIIRYYDCYYERIDKINAEYSPEREEYDLNTQKYLKDNDEKSFKELALGYDRKLPSYHPEDWKGNYIKIWKLKYGTGYNYLHWFAEHHNNPML